MIGIIGTGQIVTAAHLPAYRKLGAVVTAVFDRDPQRAAAAAKDCGATVAPSLEALLENPRVEIVDVAVVPDEQPALVERALRAGKHVLSQKPLAGTLAEARRLVELAESLGRLLVVNQQMRFSPAMLAVAQATDTIGALTALNFHIDLAMPAGKQSHWLWNYRQPVVGINTIHLLDTARALLGEAKSVTADVRATDPNLPWNGESAAVVSVHFQRGAWLLITDVRNTFGDQHANFRAEGAQGAIRGKLGLWTNYPGGEDDVLEITRLGDKNWQPLPVQGRWIPDAFAAPMAQLLAAIRTGRRPATAGRDNLKTLALVEAVYESARSGRRIENL